MNKLTNTAIVTSGLRGFASAGLATAITAFLSWSFVSATTSMDWMGSASVYSTEISQ